MTPDETAVSKPFRIYKLESSLIETAAYNKATSQLILKFKNSLDLYTYDGFPILMFGEFMASTSYGSFFHKIIKGKYQFTKK